MKKTLLIISLIFILFVSGFVSSIVSAEKWGNSKEEIYKEYEKKELVKKKENKLVYYKETSYGAMSTVMYEFNDSNELYKKTFLLDKLTGYADDVYTQFQYWTKMIHERGYFSETFFMAYYYKEGNYFYHPTYDKEWDEFWADSYAWFNDKYYKGEVWCVSRGASENTYAKLVLDHNQSGNKRLYLVLIDRDSEEFKNIYGSPIIDKIKKLNEYIKEDYESESVDNSNKIYEILNDLGKKPTQYFSMAFPKGG